MSNTNTKDTLLDRFLDKFSNSRFFATSFILHMLFVFTFGSVALFQATKQPEDFENIPGGSSLEEAAPAAPQVETPQTPTPTPTPSPVAAPSATNISALTSMAANPSGFTMPAFVPPSLQPATPTSTPATTTPIATPTKTFAGGMTAEQARGVASFTGGWRTGGQPGTVSGDGAFQFSAYVAKYSGGDWGSTSAIAKDGKITRGSLPNLLYVINKLSRDKIRATSFATPLALSSDEIFTVKPAFIFFTGTRDFILTDKEIENLRKYILVGGAIWGDSTLPGRGSRFDIAFRREMKRVVADADKQFEALPPTHPVFAPNMRFPEIKAAPAGLNYYAEPVYALKVYDEIAVIYTANSYSGMWQMAIDERGKLDTRKDEHGNMVVTNKDYYTNRDLYFRNVEDEALYNSYKFGTNMVYHLITRWEQKLRNVPRN